MSLRVYILSRPPSITKIRAHRVLGTWWKRTENIIDLLEKVFIVVTWFFLFLSRWSIRWLLLVVVVAVLHDPQCSVFFYWSFPDRRLAI